MFLPAGGWKSLRTLSCNMALGQQDRALKEMRLPHHLKQLSCQRQAGGRKATILASQIKSVSFGSWGAIVLISTNTPEQYWVWHSKGDPPTHKKLGVFWLRCRRQLWGPDLIYLLLGQKRKFTGSPGKHPP